MNITKVDGSYSKELFENMNEIKACSFSGYTTVEDMRELVLEIIEPAWIGTVARNRFIGYLNDCQSKKEIYWLCYNTVQKAMKYKPKARTA
jgi:hypothetical protein